jgi:hypothetical protein
VTLDEKCQFSMGETFAINMKVIGKLLAAIGRNKSIGSVGVPGEILKLAMVPCLARLLDLIINNATIPSDWKRVTVVRINKGEIER